MTRKKKTAVPPSISYDEWIQDKLKDPEFAELYIESSVEAVDEEGGKAALLSALKQVAECYGMSNVAQKAGMKRESLSRALSPKGNPRLTTLLAITKAMGTTLTLQKPN